MESLLAATGSWEDQDQGRDVGILLRTFQRPLTHKKCTHVLYFIITLWLLNASKTSKTLCWAVLSCFSHVRLCVTPWTVAIQDPVSMRFSRQEYWSRLSFPSLPNSGIEPASLTSPELARGFFTTSANGAGYFFLNNPRRSLSTWTGGKMSSRCWGVAWTACSWIHRDCCVPTWRDKEVTGALHCEPAGCLSNY